MCDDHRLIPVPDWIEMIPVRCYPAIGVHEYCEHDVQPRFKDIKNEGTK